MAAAATNLTNPGIFWMNDASGSDDDQPLAFVPGTKVNTPFISVSRSNQRGSKVKSSSDAGVRRSKERRMHKGHTGAKTVSPITTTATTGLSTALPLTQVESRDRSQVSLKDLCPEDKKRIANLVQELARVSEEKEVSVQRLRDEQGQFEEKIQRLEQQNLLIAHERESLQQQYRECQELLGLYQHYLSEQQAKLNASISHITQPTNLPLNNSMLLDLTEPNQLHNQAAHSTTYPGGATVNGALFNGSYLSLAPPQGHHPPVHHPSQQHPAAHQPHVQQSQAPHAHHSHAPQAQSQALQAGAGAQGGPQPLCHICHTSNSGSENHTRTSQRHCDRSHHGASPDTEARSAGISSPVLGPKDWEQKRHQLLLQKMDLELERERLRARLTEQQERVSQQNGFHPLPKKCKAGPPHSDQTEEQQCVSVPACSQTTAEVSSRSTRDMGTSPVPSSTQPSLDTPSPEPRLDGSMTELLQIFSPVCLSEKRQKSATSRSKPVLQPPRSTLRRAAPYFPPTWQPQDAEESKILEDIFFI